jgi:hypothetical protein
MCRKLKTKYPCAKSCLDIQYRFCVEFYKRSPDSWALFKEIARDKERGDKFLTSTAFQISSV